MGKNGAKILEIFDYLIWPIVLDCFKNYRVISRDRDQWNNRVKNIQLLTTQTLVYNHDIILIDKLYDNVDNHSEKRIENYRFK